MTEANLTQADLLNGCSWCSVDLQHPKIYYIFDLNNMPAMEKVLVNGEVALLGGAFKKFCCMNCILAAIQYGCMGSGQMTREAIFTWANTCRVYGLSCADAEKISPSLPFSLTPKYENKVSYEDYHKGHVYPKYRYPNKDGQQI